MRMLKKIGNKIKTWKKKRQEKRKLRKEMKEATYLNKRPKWANKDPKLYEEYMDALELAKEIHIGSEKINLWMASAQACNVETAKYLVKQMKKEIAHFKNAIETEQLKDYLDGKVKL